MFAMFPLFSFQNVETPLCFGISDEGRRTMLSHSLCDHLVIAALQSCKDELHKDELSFDFGSRFCSAGLRLIRSSWLLVYLQNGWNISYNILMMIELRKSWASALASLQLLQLLSVCVC